MNRKNFNKKISTILKNGTIEGIEIHNVDIIDYLINDKNINTKVYKLFIENYKKTYGIDNTFFMMKIQDMLYRINLFVNYNLTEKYGINNIDIIKCTFNNLIDDNNIDLFSAVSYDKSDFEIVEMQEPDVRDSLMRMKI